MCEVWQVKRSLVVYKAKPMYACQVAGSYRPMPWVRLNGKLFFLAFWKCTSNWGVLKRGGPGIIPAGERVAFASTSVGVQVSWNYHQVTCFVLFFLLPSSFHHAPFVLLIIVESKSRLFFSSRFVCLFRVMNTLADFWFVLWVRMMSKKGVSWLMYWVFAAMLLWANQQNVCYLICSSGFCPGKQKRTWYQLPLFVSPLDTGRLGLIL